MVWREIPSLLLVVLAAALAICSLPTLSAAELRCYPSDGSLWSISDLPLSPPIAPVGVVCILMPPTWPRSGVPLLIMKIGGHRGINYAYSTTLGETYSASFITTWSEEAISQVEIGFHNYRTVRSECKRGWLLWWFLFTNKPLSWQSNELVHAFRHYLDLSRFRLEPRPRIFNTHLEPDLPRPTLTPANYLVCLYLIVYLDESEPRQLIIRAERKAMLPVAVRVGFSFSAYVHKLFTCIKMSSDERHAVRQIRL